MNMERWVFPAIGLGCLLVAHLILIFYARHQRTSEENVREDLEKNHHLIFKEFLIEDDFDPRQAEPFESLLKDLDRYQYSVYLQLSVLKNANLRLSETWRKVGPESWVADGKSVRNDLTGLWTLSNQTGFVDLEPRIIFLLQESSSSAVSPDIIFKNAKDKLKHIKPKDDRVAMAFVLAEMGADALLIDTYEVEFGLCCIYRENTKIPVQKILGLFITHLVPVKHQAAAFQQLCN